jgi:hypothetical protein
MVTDDHSLKHLRDTAGQRSWTTNDEKILILPKWYDGDHNDNVPKTPYD